MSDTPRVNALKNRSDAERYALGQAIKRAEAAEKDAGRWEMVCQLWFASTEMSFKQDEDGMWSITQIEDVEGALFKPLKGDTPDAAIDAAMKGE